MEREIARQWTPRRRRPRVSSAEALSAYLDACPIALTRLCSSLWALDGRLVHPGIARNRALTLPSKTVVSRAVLARAARVHWHPGRTKLRARGIARRTDPQKPRPVEGTIDRLSRLGLLTFYFLLFTFPPPPPTLAPVGTHLRHAGDTVVRCPNLSAQRRSHRAARRCETRASDRRIDDPRRAAEEQGLAGDHTAARRTSVCGRGVRPVATSCPVERRRRRARPSSAKAQEAVDKHRQTRHSMTLLQRAAVAVPGTRAEIASASTSTGPIPRWCQGQSRRTRPCRRAVRPCFARHAPMTMRCCRKFSATSARACSAPARTRSAMPGRATSRSNWLCRSYAVASSGLFA